MNNMFGKALLGVPLSWYQFMEKKFGHWNSLAYKVFAFLNNTDSQLHPMDVVLFQVLKLTFAIGCLQDSINWCDRMKLYVPDSPHKGFVSVAFISLNVPLFTSTKYPFIAMILLTGKSGMGVAKAMTPIPLFDQFSNLSLSCWIHLMTFSIWCPHTVNIMTDDDLVKQEATASAVAILTKLSLNIQFSAFSPNRPMLRYR